MALIQVNYLSRALFRTVPVHVILPADKIDQETFSYTMKSGQKFKTLYLLHGLLGNYVDWVSGTRIERWANEKNLAVIMPSGDNAFYVNSIIPKNDYESFVGEELVSVTRKMFPLSEKREDTFIAGLSMGGYGALRTGIIFSDTFSRVAGFSSALHLFEPETNHLAGEEKIFGDFKEASKTNANPKVAFEQLKKRGSAMPEFYMSCGTEDVLFQYNEDFRDFMKKQGANVTWDEEKKGHDWDFWDSQIKKLLDWLPLDQGENGLGSGNVI